MVLISHISLLHEPSLIALEAVLTPFPDPRFSIIRLPHTSPLGRPGRRLVCFPEAPPQTPRFGAHDPLVGYLGDRRAKANRGGAQGGRGAGRAAPGGG